ncbi:MAG TPA: hypothetical protein VHP54_04605 [Caproiciproducens sp.]|nr:hypothetical protein [Caproiciproducens sp.]
MAKNGSHKWKGIGNFILSFLLSFLLFLFCTVLVVQNTVFNPDYIRTQLVNSRYYENSTAEAEEQFVSYGSASGFDETFFKSVIDINDVQLKVNKSLTVLYGAANENAAADDFEQKLNNKLIENVKSRNIAITPETEKALKLLAKTCADTYIQTVSIPYAKQLAKMLQMLQKPALYAEVLLGALTLLTALLLILLNRWRHRAVRMYIYSVSGSILMLTVLPSIFLISGKVRNISLISKSLYEFSVCYLNGFAFMFLEYALLLTVVLCVLIAVYRLMLKRINQ